MKKIFLALLALGLLVTGGLAFHARQQTEDAYHRTVHAFSQHPDVRLLESEYVRGWRQSTAATNFEVLGTTGRIVGERLRAAGVEGARHRVGFRLEHRIAHGPAALLDWLRAGAEGVPVVATADITASFDRETETDLRHAFGEPPALQVHAVVRSSGVGEARLRAPSRPLAARPSEPGRVWQGVFYGLTGEVVFTTDGLSLAGSLESDGLEGGAGPEQVEARGMVATFDLARSDAAAAWSGRTAIAFAALRLAETGPEVEGLEIVEVRGPDPDADAHLFEVALRRLTMPDGAVLGPGRMDLVVRGEAAQALAPASAEAEASPEGAPPAGGEGVAGRAMAWLPALTQQGAGLELRSLMLDTPQGRLQARGHVRHAVVPPRLLATPLALLAGVDLRLELQAPEALLAAWGDPALREGVEGLRDQGLLRLEEGRLEALLELRGGVLRAHGEVVPLEPLLGVPLAGLAASPAEAPRPQGR